MPGIVGIITKKPGKWAEPLVRQMVEAQRHESFYTSGAWKDEWSGHLCWVDSTRKFLFRRNAAHK